MFREGLKNIMLGTQQKFAEFLGLWRQEVNKYHKQLLKDNGRYYPVYFPLRLFKRCIPILNKEFSLLFRTEYSRNTS